MVEKRKLSQWFLKITDFADELIEGLGRLEHWPDKVKLMQENWIGKSQGLTFGFAVSDGGTVEVVERGDDRPARVGEGAGAGEQVDLVADVEVGRGLVQDHQGGGGGQRPGQGQALALAH